MNNYFYEGHYAYAMDDGYDNGGVVSFRDGFEAMDGDMYLSPQSQFLQMDSHTESGPGAPKSATINNVLLLRHGAVHRQSTHPDRPAHPEGKHAQARSAAFPSFNFGNAAVNLSAASTLAVHPSGPDARHAAPTAGHGTAGDFARGAHHQLHPRRWSDPVHHERGDHEIY